MTIGSRIDSVRVRCRTCLRCPLQWNGNACCASNPIALLID